MIHLHKNKRCMLAVVAALGFFSMSAFASTNSSAVKVQWGYTGTTGPSEWAQLNPAFALCGHGSSQSPINIPDVPSSASAGVLKINYQPAPLLIMDNGPTTLLIGKTTTVVNTGHSIQVNFPKTKETLSFNGQSYNLVQLHIHTPAETQLNGQTFPLEIHFVHQNSDGHIAVLAVFASVGPANPALQEILDDVPSKEGVVKAIKGETIDPSNLLPDVQSFYAFKGSLTTPPCSEGLQWIVLNTPITASSAQIQAFEKIVDGANARPVQPLNDRTVTYSKITN